MKTSVLLALLLSAAFVGMPLANSATAKPLFPFVDTFHYTQPPATSGSTDGSSISYGDLTYGHFTYGHGSYTAHGFAGFDVGEIPDSAVLLAVRLCYYQYSWPWSSDPVTTVVNLPFFPTRADSLSYAIANGLPVSAEASSPTGWSRRDLTADAIAIVDSCRRTNERVCLGIRASYSWGMGTAFGMCDWSPERISLDVEYTTSSDFSDVVAVSLAPTSAYYRAGDSLGVAGYLRNAGNQAAHNVPVRFYRNGVTYDSAVVFGVEPGESLLMTAVLPPVQSSAAVKLGMCSMLNNDWCRHNDTADLTAYVFPSAVTLGEYFEGGDSLPFPPKGWAAFDMRGPSSRWSLQPWIDRRAHTGRYYAFCGRELTLPSDDWLISPGLMPRPGRADTVGFSYASNSIEVDSLHVWVLGSQNPADTLKELSFMQAQIAWHEMTLSLDSFDGQTVHVGFRKNDHSNGWHGVSVDDVWFTSDLVPGVEEHTKLQLPTLLIAPNPARSGLVRLPCRISEPGVVDVTVSDILGRPVHNVHVTTSAVEGSVVLDCRHLTAGVYFVSLRSTTITARGKLVIH